ncbi:MAG: hypothetical protein ACLFWR_13820 [Acidimicrobiales bacterium]
MANVANLTEIDATGDVTTDSTYLYAVTLTSASEATTLEIRAGGSEGTVLLRLEAPGNETVAVPLGAAVLCADGIHATITGSGGHASLVHS